MGYSILMQWTLAPPPPGRMGISDLVLSRILEHYNISHPMRSTIQLRTFRASFPADAQDQPAPPVTRLLTTVTHSLPIPHAREVPMAPGARDNVTYLFLEDRGVRSAGTVKVDSGNVTPAERGREEGKKNGEKEDKKDGKDGKDEKDKEAENKDENDKDKESAKAKNKDDKSKLEDDGFEIVEEPKKDGAKENKDDEKDESKPDIKETKGDEPMAVDAPVTVAEPNPTPHAHKYKILAVKPATLVMPTLHQLLSPFVLGLNKSARAAASTTAQAATPAPLLGTPLMITTLTFPPMPHPQPSISLSVHILPSPTAQTIYLEAEWDGSASIETSRAILREFLLGCVPVDIPGEPKFMYWEESGAAGAAEDSVNGKGQVDTAGWFGVERTRRITFLMARAMRESQYI